MVNHADRNWFNCNWWKTLDFRSLTRDLNDVRIRELANKWSIFIHSFCFISIIGAMLHVMLWTLETRDAMKANWEICFEFSTSFVDVFCIAQFFLTLITIFFPSLSSGVNENWEEVLFLKIFQRFWFMLCDSRFHVWKDIWWLENILFVSRLLHRWEGDKLQFWVSSVIHKYYIWSRTRPSFEGIWNGIEF